MRSILRLWCVPVFVAGWLTFVPSIALASALPQTPSTWAYGSNGGRLVPGSITGLNSARTWAANITPGNVTVVDSVVARVAANDVAMTATRVIPWGAVLKGAARALPFVGTGLAVWSVYDAVRCHADGSGMLCDPGQPKTLVREYCLGAGVLQGYGPSGALSSPLSCGAGAAGAGASLVEWANSSGLGDDPGGPGNRNSTVWFVKQVSGSTVYTQFTVTSCFNGGSCATSGRQDGPSASVSVTDNLRCLTGSPGADGLCPTGTAVITSPDDAAAKVEPLPALKPNAPGIAQDAAPWHDYAPDALPVAVNGPASVTGPPQTSVYAPPTGAPVTTTTAPVYNITYAGDSYTYVTVTTVTNPSGTTTTTGEPPPAPDVCGLPGKAECDVKVDERGTPSSGDLTGPIADLDAAKDVRVGQVGEGAHGRGALPWTFSLSLPVGSCSAFSIGSRLGAVAIDPCTSSGVALWRALLAWALAAMTGLYIWRSATALNS